ncbi:CaiB/BaiF CoA transferase family protein [Bordetella bronchiseptica]|uniref:CoA-transferase family III protein n=2 Tax=Bordetella bronchiseptica TaxID=518 RepID=A0ABR4REK6_BORBO|nr:CoA transferase [Bordetella bronchiseptica]SHS71520.1 L-carnitine dehydratase/bile acid-inducible protein F [Mycobacteroides abscessus subsp. abscessus]AWP75581.1 CoA transferase [Bordetella bronchiseptica]AZW13100.1 CoA transferase [Bordetella bronchiseptica]AZW22354.1 CoA transferase [Bordetella bronchiseptica]KCV34810.1 CoA-transferase family III protein [Bordetella bronchiseptica 00-P-2796]
MSKGPLQGIRVLDFTRFLAGPYATMLMADLGADVVKIEEPGGDHTRTSGPYLNAATKDQDIGGFFNSLNRSKHGICIDLKSPGGRDLVLRMVKDVDVVVENFRGGVMEKYGLDYETLSRINPRLVYASVRGFGDRRTLGTHYPERPTVDLLVQAVSGIMGITGSADGQVYKIGPGVGDIFPGTMCLVGILAALQWRERSGEGQYVDTSMYDCMLSLCERMLYQHSYTGEIPGPMGNAHPFSAPYTMYPAADGNFVVAAPNDKFWRRIATAIGQPELGADPRFATRAARREHRGEIDDIMRAWSSVRKRDDVMAALLGHDVLAAPVNNAADIFADPEVRKRRMLVDIDPYPHAPRKVQVAGTPLKFTKTETQPQRRAPLVGEHTHDVLTRMFGLSAAEVAALERDAIVSRREPESAGA